MLAKKHKTKVFNVFTCQVVRVKCLRRYCVFSLAADESTPTLFLHLHAVSPAENKLQNLSH